MNRLPAGVRRDAAALIGLLAVNLCLSFVNAWPTPFPRPTPQLAMESLVLTGLVALLARDGRLAPRPRFLLALAFLVLVVLRYTAETHGGLLCKPIDIVADIRHLPNAALLLAGQAGPWLLPALGAALLALGAMLFALAWLATGAMAAAMSPGRRMVVAIVLPSLFTGFALGLPGFADTTAGFAAQQARQALAWLRPVRSQPTGPLPAATSGQSPMRPGRPESVDGQRPDVLVIFLESYGGAVLTDPTLRQALAEPFDRLSRPGPGRMIATALVEAPTCGGGSWLSHASLLAGRTIDNQRLYDAFLADPAPTLVDRFAAAGYRTIAAMPGLTRPWPEGAALGFDRIFSRDDIPWPGPAYGFWRIPDQAVLAWLHREALAPATRPPLFLLYPTVMSHIPFGPLPPYDEDWRWPHQAGPDRPPGGFPGFAYRDRYVAAMAYNVRVVAGFVRRVLTGDALLLVLGDHPPPAIVRGRPAPGEAWLVPAHVIGRPALLRVFLEAGFRPGVAPAPEPVGPMARLAPLLPGHPPMPHRPPRTRLP